MNCTAIFFAEKPQAMDFGVFFAHLSCTQGTQNTLLYSVMAL